MRTRGCVNLVLLDFSSDAQMLTDNDVNGLKPLQLLTSVANDPSAAIGFHNQGEGPYLGLLLGESTN